MILTIDIHPSMIGSPKEIGELVQSEYLAEVERTKVKEVEKPVEWELNKNFSDKDKFAEMISGKKLY